MLPRHDPVESLLSSVQVVKNAFSPLEIGFQRVAKDLGTCWDGVSKNEGVRRLNDLSNLWDSSNGVNSSCKCHNVSIRSLKRKSENMSDAFENSGDSRQELPAKVSIGCFFSMMPFVKLANEVRGEELVQKMCDEEKGASEANRKHDSCANCLQIAMTWPMLVNEFFMSFPNRFKTSKKKIQRGERTRNPDCKHDHDSKKLKPTLEVEGSKRELKGEKVAVIQMEEVRNKDSKQVSLECLVGFIFDQLIMNLQKLEQVSPGNVNKEENKNFVPTPQSPDVDQFDGVKFFMSFWEAQKNGVNGFIGNLSFARVGGIPSGVVSVSPDSSEESSDDNIIGSAENSSVEGNVASTQKLSDILSIPLSNVERLKSTLSTISIAELMELVPYIGRSGKEHPDKKKLFSVQDFFRYTEAEGRRFFEELDRDGDGQVTLEDLEIAMGKRKLPKRYAREFMHRTRSSLLAKSFGWRQFLSLMEQKEPTILRAYTSLCLSKSGTLQKSEILTFLKDAGLPANDDNAKAMMRFLNVDTEQSISYGHFRNFMLLLPSENLQDDFRNIWFEAATVVAVAPPVTIPTGSVLRSALAGGLSSALSCCLLHPVDTVKTRVQASTMTFPEIIAKLPQIGVRSLYRGSIPAIVGQFSSHGLRTGIFEATRLVLINVAPTLHDIQVQSLASFCSTFLGTAVRIPCEVLKQRLQAGIFHNVGEGISGTWQADGLRGFFRGTGATLCREVPFYVAGMGLYAESKKAVQRILRRELEPWETIMVGALSGGVAAIATTPFDVMKTRMMTAPQGRPVSMSMIVFSILKHEGPLGLFKGALPRFFWIAPLGAMNFAGYELARKAMDRDQTP